MCDALPKASFIGFTGTPIESGDKNTQAVFGDYVDVYDILQSKDDKASHRYQNRTMEAARAFRHLTAARSALNCSFPKTLTCPADILYHSRERGISFEAERVTAPRKPPSPNPRPSPPHPPQIRLSPGHAGEGHPNGSGAGETALCRTHDQMVQAARSGVQNIAEGSQASGTSKKTELKLTNVARASLEELRLDYEDFPRQRGLAQWPSEDVRRAELIAARPGTADDVTEWVRAVHEGPHGRRGQDGQSPEEQKSTVSIQSTTSTYAEISANGALALLTVACSLLDRQVATLEKAFVEEGGFTERLYRVRSQRRRRG